VSNPGELDGLGPTAPVGAEELLPGSTVGEYQIEKTLGQGGMGTVYAARHPVIGKRVAVKVLSYFFSKDADLVRRFTEEARSVNKIGHPNIIDVFSFGRLADGRQYFVMEYLEGETVTAWLERGRPPANESRRFLLQACEALEAAHREGIVHRDLKPDNLWIARPKHGEPYIKVLDFGLAKLMAGEQEKPTTRTGTIMGTPEFMSPEQCVGRGVDHRTDIYALGAIIFRVYCGRLAFTGSSSAEVLAAQLYQDPPKPSSLAAIPATLETLILDCLAKDPARRPASAAELGSRLREATQRIGAATEIVAPASAITGLAADTQKGFATAQPSQSPKSLARRWPVAVAVGLLVGIALAVAIIATRKVSVASKEVRAVAPAAATLPVSMPAAPATVVEPAAAEPRAIPAPASATPQPTPALAGVGEATATDGTPGVAPKARRRTAVRTPQTPHEPAASGVPAVGPHKPSRAAREGLIQENPF
jgi:eukaryotic-like serine/threonine-protein kinase